MINRSIFFLAEDSEVNVIEFQQVRCWNWVVAGRGRIAFCIGKWPIKQLGILRKYLKKAQGIVRILKKAWDFLKLRIIKLGIYLFCYGASLENTWSYFICNALQSMGVLQETLTLDLQLTMVLTYENCKLIACPENLKGHMTDRHCQPVVGLECPANFLHMFCCWCQMQLFQLGVPHIPHRIGRR